MADTTALKNRIRAAIKANDNQEITGPVLQQSLLDIVDELNGATETEASQRQSGDSTLQQGINTERQARIDADNALGQRITDERQARIDADNALGQRITDEIQQEHQRAEAAFDNLDIIDAAGSALQPTQITLTLRKNDGQEQDPDWRTLAELVLPSATTLRAGLMGATDKKTLQIRPNLSIAAFSNSGPVFSLNTSTKKLSVDNKRIFVFSGGRLLKDTVSNLTYETDFVGAFEKTRLSYLVYNLEANKLYLVDFGSIVNYPEFDTDGVNLNLILGGIVLQNGIDHVSIGFSFSCIEIDGSKYYGCYKEIIPDNPTKKSTHSNLSTSSYIHLDLSNLTPNTRFCAVLESEDIDSITSFSAYVYKNGNSYRAIPVANRFRYDGKIYITDIYTQDDIDEGRNICRIYFNTITSDNPITVNVTYSYFTENIQWQDPRLVLASEVDRLDSRMDKVTYPLTISSFNTDKPSFSLDFTTKKLSVDNARNFITDGGHLLVQRSSNETYETDFVGNVNKYSISYIIYHKADNQLYLVGFGSIVNYPEYNNEHSQVLNIYLGTLIQQTTGVWTFGFNFGKINIDGQDYLGTFGYKQVNDIINPILEQLNGILPIIPEKTNFIELVRTANFFNKDTVVHGYYGFDGIIYQDSDIYWCSDFIPVEEGKTYIRVGSSQSYFVYAYNENKVPVAVVDGNKKVYWQEAFESTPIPEGIAFVRLIFQPDKIDEFAFYDTENIPSQYVPYAYYHLRSDIRVDEPEPLELFEYSSSRYGTSEVGNLDYQEIDECDYSQIIMYGQSLSMGWEAPEAILEDALPGVYMVGDKVAIGHGNNGQNVLNPLISTEATSCGENPTVGAMNAFAKMYKRFVSKEQKFIATSCGEGGKSIEQLSKECTNNGSGTTVANLYHTQFLTTLNRTKTTVDNLGKTVGCFAILFMQGEYNYANLSGGGMTVGTDATNDKDAYKAYLLTLKNNMQADIMATYGQTKKPLFFIYEVAGSYINRYDMSINMAQIEFALENDDVFLLSPTYPVPDYGGGHLSTNGYRWYGEMMAKSLYEVFIHGKNFKPLMPEKFEIVGSDMKTIKIDFYVPVMPILFDAYTKEQITNQGFRVRVDDADVTISNVYIKENSVFLVMPSTLENKKVEVAYAGQSRSGSGNLRDSDTYHSLYTYYDDRETSPSKRENYTPKDKNGNYIYGKPYPMFNWCGNFYKLIQEAIS